MDGRRNSQGRAGLNEDRKRESAVRKECPGKKAGIEFVEGELGVTVNTGEKGFVKGV